MSQFQRVLTVVGLAAFAFFIVPLVVGVQLLPFEPQLRTIQVVLVIVWIIAPAIIGVFMIVFLVSKRCPVCGSKLTINQRRDEIAYRCNTCNYYSVKEKTSDKKELRGVDFKSYPSSKMHTALRS